MCVKTQKWHEPFLPMFHITPGMLPKICSNSEHYGVVAKGRLAGVPITGGV
jgi:glycerol kinase